MNEEKANCGPNPPCVRPFSNPSKSMMSPGRTKLQNKTADRLDKQKSQLINQKQIFPTHPIHFQEIRPIITYNRKMS